MTTTKTTFKVKPINNVEEGIKQGNYTSHYDYIIEKTVPLKEVTEEKEITLVCFNRTIGETEYIELLKQEGLKPCEDAPNYLLGLMAQYKESDLLEEFKNKDIIAANVSSVFTDEFGHPCFLYVYRHGRDRGLVLARVGRGWFDDCVFLAESLETQPLIPSSEPLITISFTQEEYKVLKSALNKLLK